jgi:hypothetical protein
VRHERSLRLYGRRDCVTSTGEGEEERISLRVDLAASVFGKCSLQQSLVVGENGVVSLTQLPQQSSRAFDVAEEESYGALRRAARWARETGSGATGSPP